MCGIVGFATVGKPSVQDAVVLEKFFRKALLLDVVRGKDSTGVASINVNGEVNVYKKALPSYEYLEFAKARSITTVDKQCALIGHNRAATKGAVSVDNAHPFTHGDITLVHNGTLNNQNELDGNSNFDTDSETICYNINKHGAKHTLEKISGSYALVWYDKSDHTLNFARNSKRPLILAAAKEGLLFASEEWIIEGASSEQFSHSVTIEKGMKSLTPLTLMKISLDTGEVEETKFKENKSCVNHYGVSCYTPAYRRGQGDGSMEKLGLTKGDSVLFELTSVSPYKTVVNNVTKQSCAVHGRVVSNVKGIPDIEARAYSCDYSSIKNIKDSGVVVFRATVADDSYVVEDCITVENVQPVCGRKRLEKGKLPKRYDGVYQAKKETEEWEKSNEEDSSISGHLEHEEWKYYDPDNKPISKKEWDTIAKGGCAACGHPVSEDDYEYFDGHIVHSGCVDSLDYMANAASN